ncbi:hypothetical protein CKO38_15850 [Rhodospirillum rubrum]|uniref:hypothetical protein n=1 Tax=Rhodospirillum rubrum TaxID=1085 RepID=UPI001907257A|nr:hypothetical protein [Rhodospirillum rubrum]MBK1666023.1 hypothetical protein [Rhodospirillum rubrum]MBK1678116.1 hypothetical protein [Rhodospirillum rubrum]
MNRDFPNRSSRSERPGILRRVTQGVADRLGLSRRAVIVLFVLGGVMNLPLALLVFLTAWYWVDNAGAIERGIDGASSAVKRTLFGDKSGEATRERPSDGPGVGADAEADFPELRRAFADLERRTGRMETHVTSEDYALNKKFRDLERGAKGPIRA